MKKIKEFMIKIMRSIGNFVKKHKLWTFFIIIVLIAVFIGIQFINFVKKRGEQHIQSSVMTTSLSKMDLTSSVSVTGNLASIETKSVSTTLNDVPIEAVNAEVGDYVNAGDTIIVFDTEDIQYELETTLDSNNLNNLKGDKSLSDAAEGVLEAQEKYTEQAAALQQDVNSAFSEYNTLSEQADAAKTKYEAAVKEKENAKEKYDAASVSSNTIAFNEAREALKKAEEALTSAKSEYDDLETKAAKAYANYYGRLNDQTEGNEKNADQIEESVYNYKVTTMERNYNRKTQTHQVQQAEKKLGKAVVTAPISGIITAVNVEAGDNYNGSTLFVIQDVSTFVVQATVDEYDISDISKGLKAVVKTDATDDEEFTGTVTYVSPTPVSNSSEGQNGITQASTSASYEIEIVLDDYSDRMRIGMTAKTSIILDSADDVFAVAYDCVHTDTEGNSYIEIMDNRKDTVTDLKNDSDEKKNLEERTNGTETIETKRIYVEIGMESDYYTQIISDELYEGMQIVATASSGDKNSSDNMNFDFNMGGGMPDGGGGNRGGNMPGGGGNHGGNMPGGF